MAEKNINKKDTTTIEAIRDTFYTILDSSPDIITISDLNGVIIECSAATVSVHGFDSKEELIGRSAFDLISPEDHSRAGEALNAIIKKGILRNMEYRLLRKDGSLFDAELSVAAIKSSEGDPVGFIAIVKDISERKHGERMLAESEEKLRGMFDSAADAIAVADTNAVLVDMNEAAVKMHRIKDKSEMIGLNSLMFIKPEELSKAQWAIKEVLEKGSVSNIESVFLRKNGMTEFPIEISVSLLRDHAGNPSGFVSFIKDITERKEAERLLRESEEKYRALVEATDTGYLILDEAGRVVDANQEYVRLTGRRSLKKILGRTVAEWTAPHDRERNATEVEKCARLGYVRNLEIDYMTPEGGIVPVEINAQVVDTSTGKRIVSLCRDITLRKLSQDELVNSEARYRRLTENLGSEYLFYTHDENGIFTYLSPSVTDMLGYSRDEFLKHYSKYMTDHPVNLEVERHTRMSLRGIQQPTYEVDIFHKDGGTRRLEVTETPVLDERGNVIAVEGVAHDITERKKAEDALRGSEEQLRLLFENTKDAIFQADAETGILINCNRSAEELIERPRDEIIGMSQALLHTPETREEAAETFRKHAGRGGIKNEVMEAVTKSGKAIPVLVSSTVNMAGDRPIITGFFRDISDIRQAQAEKEALLQQLHQSQKMEAIGQLAGGIAHDFNNILSVIIGSAEMTAQRLPKDSPFHNNMERIIKVSRRARDLTMKLLTFARKEKLDVRAVPASEIIAELSDLLKRTISRKIMIRTDSRDGAPLLAVDINQIIQALLNVCINAADAMPDGGTLTMQTSLDVLGSEECRGLEGLKPGAYCRITITDTGCGMTPEVREQIFNPFFTTKEPGKGTGLGLPILLGIIQGHGGAVSVESAPGRGTSVSIYLPAAQSPDAAREEPEPPREKPAEKARGTVLVIDDDLDFLEMAAELLEHNGLKAIPAHGPARGLEIYNRQSAAVDLVLLDMMMPDMDGAETFRLLRKMKPDAKIVICSGFSSDGRISEILAEGASGFLQKPFTSEQLARTVSAALK